ncbi:unnamed protein product [Orchesella dallaii]|uniref:CRAL-TRIO domain-containing protein n=1 Tax=Orchesella dallaii TaxID=48710 RepID=A0ABP1QK48_9HEXA
MRTVTLWERFIDSFAFREIVAARLPHDYMKEDIYLIRWLRAQNFDLKKSEQMLMTNLKWREDNKMDGIHEENWDDMEAEYPYHIEGLDKRGQPVVTGNIGDWDLRRASVTGRIQRVLRYLDKAMDEATIRIREMQKEGKNVTQFVFIVNLDNFNLAQHTCGPCAAGFLQFLRSYENHFTGSADQIIMINVAPLFEFVLQVVKSTVTPQTRDAMHVFGKNKPLWGKYVLEFIDKNQLTPEYGGVKET